MRLYRNTYTTAGGRKQSPRWYIAVQDHDGRERRLAAFPDKSASHTLGRKIEALVARRMAGDALDRSDLVYLHGLPKRIQAKLDQWGLVDRRSTLARQPMAEHVADYRQQLDDAGCTPQHVRDTVHRIGRVVESCGWKLISEMDGVELQGYLAARRRSGLAVKTCNHYLVALKGFAKWAVQQRRIAESPFLLLKKANPDTDPRRTRRSLSDDELRRLVQTTEIGPKHHGMTGPERAMLYRLAIETGLRANELRSLRRSSFDFDAGTVSVQAAHSKRRRLDCLPLRPATAQMLAWHLRAKMPQARAFTLPGWRTAEMVRADLAAAGIPEHDASGAVFDFHAFRHQTASSLARGRVHPKIAQELMRHSTVELTMQTYTHSFRGDVRAALDVLPDLDTPAAQRSRKTGTCAVPAEVAAVFSSQGPGTIRPSGADHPAASRLTAHAGLNVREGSRSSASPRGASIDARHTSVSASSRIRLGDSGLGATGFEPVKAFANGFTVRHPDPTTPPNLTGCENQETADVAPLGESAPNLIGSTMTPTPDQPAAGPQAGGDPAHSTTPPGPPVPPTVCPMCHRTYWTYANGKTSWCGRCGWSTNEPAAPMPPAAPGSELPDPGHNPATSPPSLPATHEVRPGPTPSAHSGVGPPPIERCPSCNGNLEAQYLGPIGFEPATYYWRCAACGLGIMPPEPDRCGTRPEIVGNDLMTDPLVEFLYLLIRDELTPGCVFGILYRVTGQPTDYSSKPLALVAAEIAFEIRKKEKP